MDFSSLKRNDLQKLCKNNNIPANWTNEAMAAALQSLKSHNKEKDMNKEALIEANQTPSTAVRRSRRNANRTGVDTCSGYQPAQGVDTCTVGTRTRKGKKEEAPAEAVDVVVVDTPTPQRGRRKAVETPAQGVVPGSSARLTRQATRRLAESAEGARVRTLTKMALDPADEKEAETDVIELGRATEPKPADKLEVEEVADQNRDVDLVKEDELVSDEKLNLVEHHAEQIGMCEEVTDKVLSDHGSELDLKSMSWRKLKEQWVQLEREFKIMEEKQAQAASVNSILEESVQALVAQVEVLKRKYSEEMARSRRLFNELQESKGNIRVFCRCRPLNKDDMLSGYKAIVDFDTTRDGEIGILTGGATKKTFKFDRIFTPKDDQADVYADASPLVTSVLDGYNVCIFAYGQTGTGKTFTMEGTERKRGVNYLTLEELFKIAEERKETVSYGISVSVLEVYNEQIRDLLNPNPSSKKLEIRAEGEGLHHIPGLVETEVESTEEVWNVLQAGSNARAIGSNNVNKHSSRSHCMLCVTVKANNLVNGECTKSKLWLVDLAGSERLAKTDVQGERLKEAQNINRSLSSLGDVISALANKSNHIPYRNSKLTHLLQDSLAGDSKTLMFVQISPSDNDLGETLGSLNFASRVRGIEMGPAKKQADKSEVQKMKQIIENFKQEAKLKDEKICKLEENCHSLENKLKGSNKSLQEKMEIQKAEYEATLEKQNCQLSEKLKEKDEICSTLNQKVRSLQRIIKELRDKPTQMNNTPKANEMSKILANSNYKKPPVAATVSMKDSVLLSGVESLHETKGKRTSDSVPGDNENSVPVVELKKKSVLSEPGNSSKMRRIDPARLTRSTSGASSTHNALPNGRAAGKEQPTGSKMRGWVR